MPESNGKCIVCLKSIPLGAQICTECGSYQDFRRHVFLWSALVGGAIGGLIALFTLYDAARSLHQLAFPPSSRVSIRQTLCQESNLTLILQNSGGRAAHLFDFNLEVRRNQAIAPLDYNIFTNRDDASIDAYSLNTIVYPLYRGQTWPQVTEAQQCTIEVSFRSVDSQSEDVTDIRGICQCFDT